MNARPPSATARELLARAAAATSGDTPEQFFAHLVRHLAEAFGASRAIVGEIAPENPDHIRVLASWKNGAYGRPFVYSLAGSPCEDVLSRGTCWHADAVAEKFPRDEALARHAIAFYAGTPLVSSTGRTLGLIAVMDEAPHPPDENLNAFLTICANRAGIELERLQARERSEQSEHFLQRIIETAPSIIHVYDLLERRTVYANLHLAEQLGYRPDQVAELPADWLQKAVHPDDREHLPANRDWHDIDDDVIIAAEYRLRGADGRWHWFLERSSVFLRTPDGRVGQILGAALEITELKEAQENLARSERDYRALFEQADDGIFIATSDRRIIGANPAGCRLFGYTRDELLGLRTDDLIDPDHLREHPLRYPEHEPEGYFLMERVLRRKDGSTFLAEVSARLLQDGRRQAIIRNIDTRRQLEEQIRQTQKLELVGRLAGGVAHDLNNLLQAIIGFATMAQSPESEDDRREALTEILASANRARDITRQLLAFGRRQTLKLADHDPTELIRGVMRMLERLVGSTIALAFTPEPPIGKVRCDRTQIEQVLMNLCVNARDAMPEGGTITIGLRRQQLDRKDLATHPRLRPGPFVCIEVTDTGTGIAPENLSKIFEPFFSTKTRDTGTGLGLSVVHGIIEQHGGMIRVRSTPGRGTTFEVFLPELASETRAAPPRSSASDDGREQTLLVAEDDAAVRALLRRILSRAGYRLILASNGQEAVELFSAHRDDIDAAVFDVMMPTLKGHEALMRIRQTRPDLPAVLFSGYMKALALKPGELGPHTLLLRKPFKTEEFLAAIARLVS